MNKKLLIASVFILIFENISHAQTNYLMNSNTAVTVTCPATNTYFYDDGNSGANYTASKHSQKPLRVQTDNHSNSVLLLSQRKQVMTSSPFMTDRIILIL